MVLTEQQLDKLAKGEITYLNRMLIAINDTLTKYQINTPLRISHFVGQIQHESGNFSHFVEDLHYSAERLMKIFPRYFPTLESTKGYAMNPEKIANKVYANRMGNGNEASGDGWRNRGKGLIMITGEINTEHCKKDLGLTDDEQLAKLPWIIVSAGWYWNECSLNTFADKDDILTITKKINGGTIGLDDRKFWVDHAKSILM